MATSMVNDFSPAGLVCVLRENAYKIRKFDIVTNLRYSQFFQNHLVPNCPCVFLSELTDHWRSRRNWVADDGSPNYEYLQLKFGGATVPVANCKQEQYSAHPKEDWLLADYLKYWQEYRHKGYPPDQDCLYLKDWHFTKAFPDYKAYETPVYFQSDWLNEFWDTLPQDDYRFVYMGPKGTWTPFHTDVYRSFSWSANICGRKKWIFYPPGCEESLKDKFGHLVYDVTSPDLADPVKYPRATEVKDKVIEVIQEPGQVIFVPSGWHHQVYNLEDTISINHNWLNGCNIDLSWTHLEDSLEQVKTEIADCRDMDGWHDQCQIILRASAGLDFKMFVDLLETIATNRINTWKYRGVVSADMANRTPERITTSAVTTAYSTNNLNHNDLAGRKAPDKIGNADKEVVSDIKELKHTTSDIKDIRKANSEERFQVGLCDASNFFKKDQNEQCQTGLKEREITYDIEKLAELFKSSGKITEEEKCKLNQFLNTDNGQLIVLDAKSKCLNQEHQDLRKIVGENWLICDEEFCLYDITRIKYVLQSMMGNEDLEKLPSEVLVRIKQLFDDVNETVHDMKSNF